MTDDVQAVIIGGGVAGASIAYHLTKLGWRDVVVLDRSELTSGSTFHSAGLVGQLRSTVTLTRMMMYGVELYRRLADETGRDPGWHEVGSLRLASSREQLLELQRGVSRARGIGLDVELLSAKEACALIQRNALIKTKVVQQDEFEQGDRKLLNFGHTLGHALETQYELSHGEAISIGMAYASKLSQNLLGFKEPERVIGLLDKYGLPTYRQFDKDKVIRVLKMDKKKTRDSIHFILLERIGKAVIQPIPINQLYESL